MSDHFALYEKNQRARTLSARIFAVVDQWDALTSDRPYRNAWTREKVIAYFRENAGKIYDPEIVDVFSRLV